jgi:hypothetical protein
MKELFKEIEPEQRYWELSQGNHFRASILWETQMMHLKAQLQQLHHLKTL